MRYYSTSSAVVTLLRKEGFYMSDRTARYVATKVLHVFGYTPDSRMFTLQRERMVVQLTCGTDGAEGYGSDSYEYGTDRVEHAEWTGRYQGFTPAENRIIHELLQWYSVEQPDGQNSPTFLLVNLNEGLSLVFSERKTRKGSSS